jgi:DNA replication protein DnaC
MSDELSQLNELNEQIDKVMQAVREAAPAVDGCNCRGDGLIGDGTNYRFCVCPEGRAKRRRAVVRRLVDQAGIPKRFERVTFEQSKADQASHIQEWAEAYPDTDRHSLYLYSKDYGVGKTGLAVCVLRRLIERGNGEGRFIVVDDWLRATRESFNGPGKPEDIRDVELLLFDDLGIELETPWSASEIASLIHHRHAQCLPTLFTSNYDPNGLIKRYGQRTTVRIEEMAEVIKITGPDMRSRKI